MYVEPYVSRGLPVSKKTIVLFWLAAVMITLGVFQATTYLISILYLRVEGLSSEGQLLISRISPGLITLASLASAYGGYRYWQNKRSRGGSITEGSFR